MNNKAIGVFDSGVGGISVLRELVTLMPYENYIYYGDCFNAPYGNKPILTVRSLTERAVEVLMNMGVKALVVACNTATSAAVRYLRSKYTDLPVIGIEPAVKPAVMYKKNSRILVMATPVTLREEKFCQLADAYSSMAEIISVPCDGLASLIEDGNIEGEEIENYLKATLSPYLAKKTDSIVLGCTHYPFAISSISKVVGENIRIFDGGAGVARETKNRLSALNAFADNTEGTVICISSGNSAKLVSFAKKFIDKNNIKSI